MANKDHLALLRQGVFVWNEWRQRNPELKPVLSLAKLSLAKLSSIDFRSVNLSQANLKWSDLSHANLSHANLKWTNLSLANLSHANLNSANFSTADLSRSNLSHADLTNANLSLADLTGADLTGAKLSGANLTGANLGKANLTNANLTGANLFKAQALGTDFTQAVLTAAYTEGWIVDHETKLDTIIRDNVEIEVQPEQPNQAEVAKLETEVSQPGDSLSNEAVNTETESDRSDSKNEAVNLEIEISPTDSFNEEPAEIRVENAEPEQLNEDDAHKAEVSQLDDALSDEFVDAETVSDCSDHLSGDEAVNLEIEVSQLDSFREEFSEVGIVSDRLEQRDVKLPDNLDVQISLSANSSATQELVEAGLENDQLELQSEDELVECKSEVTQPDSSFNHKEPIAIDLESNPLEQQIGENGFTNVDIEVEKLANSSNDRIAPIDKLENNQSEQVQGGPSEDEIKFIQSINYIENSINNETESTQLKQPIKDESTVSQTKTSQLENDTSEDFYTKASQSDYLSLYKSINAREDSQIVGYSSEENADFRIESVRLEQQLSEFQSVNFEIKNDQSQNHTSEQNSIGVEMENSHLEPQSNEDKLFDFEMLLSQPAVSFNDEKFTDRDMENNQLNQQSNHESSISKESIEPSQGTSVIELNFGKEIDWKAFLFSLQALQRKYESHNIKIQSLENQSDGVLIIRLKVPSNVDKVQLENQAWELYTSELDALELEYYTKQRVTHEQIADYRQQSTDLMRVIELQAANSIQTDLKAVSKSNSVNSREQATDSASPKIEKKRAIISGLDAYIAPIIDD